MSYLDKQLKIRLEEKLQRLNRYRPLPPALVKKLKEQFEIEMTYNSNGIEGNSLTLKETFLVINEGITIKGKPLKDHLEAKNHYEALEYLADLVAHQKTQTVSEVLIRHLHQMVIQDIDKEWAGRYRDRNVIIGGADHTPPEAIEIPSKMNDLIGWLKDYRKKPITMHEIKQLQRYIEAVEHCCDGIMITPNETKKPEGKIYIDGNRISFIRKDQVLLGDLA